MKMFQTRNTTNTNNKYSDISTSTDVKKTYNYSYFKRMIGNREINKLHFNRLFKSISEKSLRVPIIVNEKYEICDGQTRFDAWVKLEKPIYFIINKGYNLSDVQRLNENTKNWSLSDYTHSFSEEGREAYITYKHFKEKYKFDDYASISMLRSKDNGSGTNFKLFRSGDFKVTSLKKAIELANEIYKLKDVYDGFRRRSFVLALIHLLNHKNFKMNVFVRKLKYKSNKGKLVDCTTKPQYLTLIQDIYNTHTTKKVNLIYND